MIFRFALFGVCFCCVSVSAWAQEPAPIDGQTQAQLDLRRSRVTQIRLQHVQPSLMAFWLDPKNNAGKEQMKIEKSDGRLILRAAPRLNSPLPPGFKLPAGVERVVGVDPQKSLLVFGTNQGVEELRKIIAFLDRPERRVEVDVAVYWLDSLAVDGQKWNSDVPQTHSLSPDERVELDALVQADRATLLPLSFALSETGASATLQLPFERTSPTRPNNTPFIPHPLLQKGLEIDPDFVMPRDWQRPRITLGQSQLRVKPQVSPSGSISLDVDVSGAGALIQARAGETIAWSGSAQAFGLKPPSARFDRCVWTFTPRLVNPTP